MKKQKEFSINEGKNGQNNRTSQNGEEGNPFRNKKQHQFDIIVRENSTRRYIKRSIYSSINLKDFSNNIFYIIANWYRKIQ